MPGTPEQKKYQPAFMGLTPVMAMRQQVAVPHDWAISGPFDKKWESADGELSSRMAKPRRPRSRDVLVRRLGLVRVCIDELDGS